MLDRENDLNGSNFLNSSKGLNGSNSTKLGNGLNCLKGKNGECESVTFSPNHTTFHLRSLTSHPHHHHTCFHL